MNHWIEVSEQRLRANLDVLRRAAGEDVTVLAVIKANAYGHGVEMVAPVLAAAGAEWLGVTDVDEGVLVRKVASRQVNESASQSFHSAQPSILVMSGLGSDEAAAIVEHGLTPVAWSVEQLRWLEAAGLAAGRQIRVHVEVDTGMSRQGAAPGDDLEQALRMIAESEWLRLDGVFTHFASAEIAGSPQTEQQRISFEAAMQQVAQAGLNPVWVHAGNSSLVDEGVLLDWLRDLAAGVNARAMVRPGIALYGHCLPLEGGLSQVRPALQPVMTWKAKVIGLREIAEGTRVGYSGTFVAQRPMRVALLPVGYADGLRRELSSTNERGGGWVMLDGQRAPIVGRVSMNLTVVDVTEIDGAALGDVVTVLGDGVTAEDHAQLAETLAYEILCGVRGEIRLVG